MAWKDYTANINDNEGGPATARAIDALVTSIRNNRHISRNDAIKQIFLWGVECGLTMDATDGVGEEEKEEVKKALEEAAHIRYFDQRAKERADLERAYKKFGAEEFMELAQKRGMDLDKVEHLMSSRKVTSLMSWYEKVKRWLVVFIEERGECGIQEIKRAAIARGLLVDPETDPEEHRKQWVNIKNCASDLGMSSYKHRGYWRSISNELPIQ